MCPDNENRIFNNINYNFKKLFTSKKGITYIRCKEKITKQCYARGKIVQGQLIWTTEHNHDANIHNICIQAMKQDLFETVISTLDDLRKIYDRISLLHPDAAPRVTFTSVESSMRRWRQKFRPPIPRSLGSYVDIINMEKWEHFRKHEEVSLTVSCIIAEDFSVAAVIGDVQFLRQLNVKELYIDATFKVCPRKLDIYQLLTIMGRVSETVIPITWAFMEKKTTEAYVAVLNKFKRDLAPHFNPTVITIDFEQALSSAINRVFPAVSIHRCYFHHIQALMRRLNKNGPAFIERLKNWDEGMKFYRKLTGIALLPAADIPAAFDWLIQNATPDILTAFEDLITYYRNWWLHQVTPAKFTAYKNLHKTTNEIEAYHRVLLQRVGEHPSIWRMTLHLLQLQYVTRNEYMSIVMGLPVRRPVETRYKTRSEIIMRAWTLYEQQLLDIPRFLATANHFLLVFNNRAVINRAVDVDFFINALNHNIDIHLVRPDIEINIINNENRIPILRPTIDECNNFKVVLLRNLEQSKCILCGTYIANYICVPCWHWFACENCTVGLITLAATEQADLRCRICAGICIAFKKILIT